MVAVSAYMCPQPLEISLVQAKLKAAGLGIAKDKLADILDFMVSDSLGSANFISHTFFSLSPLSVLHSQNHEKKEESIRT